MSYKGGKMKSNLYINGKPVDTSTMSGKKAAIKVYVIFVVALLAAIAFLSIFNVKAYINTQIKKYGTLTDGIVVATILEEGDDDEADTYKIKYRFERTLPNGEKSQEERVEKVSINIYNHYEIGDHIAVKYDSKGRSILAENFSTNFFKNAGIIFLVELIFIVVWIGMFIGLISSIIIKNRFQKLLNGEGTIVEGFYLGMTYGEREKRGINYSWTDEKGRTHESTTGDIYDENTALAISKLPSLSVRHIKKISTLVVDSQSNDAPKIAAAKTGKVVCEYCGSSFDDCESKCPNCGAKIK